MRKIVFISTIVLGLAALNTSTNVNASMLTENHEKVIEVNTELIDDVQADTIAELGTAVKPITNFKNNDKDNNIIVKLKELPKKVIHHKVRHHKKANKKKTTHVQVVNTSVNQTQNTNTQTTNTQTTQSQSSMAQSSSQQSVQSSQPVQKSRQQTQYSQNSSSAAEQIAQAESGGSYTAQNSKYYGKYQLDSSYLHGDYSPANQERVFRQYCQQRYGSVEGALAFRQQHGWY